MKRFPTAFLFLMLLAATAFSQTNGNKYVNWSLGYYTTWDGTYTPENLPWEAFTAIAYFQVWPNSDGSLRLPSDDVAKRLIAAGHAKNKKVVFCVGGAGVGDAFKGACSNANRGKFISNLIAYLKRLGYDGIDTDWEEAFDNTLFVQWHKDLRDSINKLTPVPMMTIAAEDWFQVTAQVHMYVDQINDMRYTGTAADKSKLGAGMGVSMGMNVQQVTDMCNMVVTQGYGGVILWDVTRNSGAPDNMAAVAKFVNPNAVNVNPGPTKYYDPITLSVDDRSGSPEIHYSVSSASRGSTLDLGVYDMRGALVKTLVHGPAMGGQFSMPLKAGAGTYVVRLSAGDAYSTSKTITAR